MKCAHLTISRAIRFCAALRNRYLPSQFEIEEYCKTSDHRKCPLYLKEIISVDQTKKDLRVAHL
jgi:hypothetical protein